MFDDPIRPDAVIFPDSWKTGENTLHRADSLIAHAEKRLQTDHTAGEKAHVRHVRAGGNRFCTHDIRDTLLFPLDHPRAGQNRYRWERQDDGAEFGYLVDDEAREACRAKV